MLLRVTVAREDLCTMVRLVGELDLLSQAVAVGAIDGAINTDSVRVTLDLAGVTFIDTSGASGLVRMQQKAERVEVDLVVVNVSPPAARVLQISGFREVMRAPMVLAC
jgi:anti-anti-sigma factor